MKDIFNNLFGAFEHIDLSKVDGLNYIKADLKVQAYGKMIGANWTLEYMSKFPDIFKDADKVIFESTNKVDEVTSTTIRRVDVETVKNDIRTFYEFKSIKNLPPADFARQFIKDLTNADSLNQIKWIFDGKKLPNGIDKDVMLDALAKGNISQQLIEKWVKNPEEQNLDGFMNFIDSNFNTIFKAN